MSNLLHPKYHRRNHHTYGNSVNPDAGHDPIASPDSPFLGDFVLAGGLSASAPLSGYAGSFSSQYTALIVKSPELGLLSLGDVSVVGDLKVSGTVFATTIGQLLTSDPPITYSAGKGIDFINLSETSRRIDLNIDNETLILDPYTSRLEVNVGRLSAITVQKANSSIDYSFSNGLYATRTGIVGNTFYYSVSANVDDNTIKINGGKLQAKQYSFLNGLSSQVIDNYTVGVYPVVDNNSIKIVDGKIVGGYSFGDGLSVSNGVVTPKLDSSSLCLNSSKEVSVKYNFNNCGLSVTGGNLVGVKVDNTSVRLNPSTGEIGTYNSVCLNAPGINQIMTGGLTVKGTLSAGSGITFADGTVLTTAGETKAYVTQLATQTTDYYSIVVATSDKRLIGVGQNDHFSVNYADAWPPLTLKFKDNYTLRRSVSIVKTMHSRFHTMALLSDGTLWISGYNAWQQQGIDKSSNSNTGYREFALNKVIFMDGALIKDFVMACDNDDGVGHFAAISFDNKAYTWGYNRGGALGHGNASVVTTPTEPGGSGFTNSVKDIKVYVYDGYGYTQILHTNGSVWAAGYNDYGQLGIGASGGTRDTLVRCLSAANAPIGNITKLLNNNTWNFQTMFLLDVAGQVWASGLNNNGQLGKGTTDGNVHSYYEKVGSLTGVKEFATSGSSTYSSYCAITNNGEVYTWGYNGYGQCGQGTTTTVTTPTRVYKNPTESVKVPIVGSKVYGHSGYSSGGLFAIIDIDSYLWNAGYYAFGQTDVDAAVVSIFQEIPLANVKQVQTLNNTADNIGLVILDKSNRVFVCNWAASSYISGSPYTARMPREITNSLV
jgi:alpha-tubulin suppressor-like RCC1 family protein